MTEVTPLRSTLNPKKVHFKEDKLVELIVFPDYEESADIRKAYWEIFARDRCRFKDRISQTEIELNKIIGSDHRQHIYDQRFRSRKHSTDERGSNI